MRDKNTNLKRLGRQAQLLNDVNKLLPLLPSNELKIVLGMIDGLLIIAKWDEGR